MQVDLFRRAHLADLAVAHHRDPVGHRQRLALVVGDQDRGGTRFAQGRPDVVAQLHAQRGVERAERLVQQHQRRPRGQRPGQSDALLLAAGELGGVGVRAVREPEPFLNDIAGYVAPYIEDGSTLQIGIGRTTEELVKLGMLDDKQDLGFHSEVTVPGIISVASITRKVALRPRKRYLAKA